MTSTARALLLGLTMTSAQPAADLNGLVQRAGGVVRTAGTYGLLVEVPTPAPLVYALRTPAGAGKVVREVVLTTGPFAAPPEQWRAVAAPLALVARVCLGAAPDDVASLQAWLSDPVAASTTSYRKFRSFDVRLNHQLTAQTYQRSLTVDLKASAGANTRGCVHSLWSRAEL